MANTYTQQFRPTAVSTRLGPDVLLLERMTAKEVLGRPFTFELELLSTDFQIDIESLLGTPMGVECEIQNEGKRYFHGRVANFSQTGVVHDLCRYRATLRPWLWLLTRTADCRIFQNMKAPDIIEKIFGDQGFSDYELRLVGAYREREYCVQYRESDFNFVSRLMEEEGIYYFFEYTSEKHTLVLCEAPDNHAPFEDYDEIPYRPPDEHADKPDHINHWTVSAEVQSGRYALRDFDYLNPKANLETQASADRSHDHAKMEIYDYPGLYEDPQDGERYVQCRLDELQAAGVVFEGAGPVRGIATGSLFQLTDFPRQDQNRKYLVTSATYELINTDYRPLNDSAGKLPFHCRFTAIESETLFHSPRITRKPFVQGPQTAIVVGKAGEEIWTDEHGRVKVQFHWDREGKNDENSSCWIRVSSLWAGTTWGAVQLPRIGQEVIVDFLEGDPDRPIITGRVYNQVNKPALKLPDDKTRSTIKSRSTKDGNDKTFNELRFEDKKDQEEVYFHAERDFNRVVENNDTLKVGFDKKKDGDQEIEIHNNQKLVVGNAQSKDGSQTIEIWKDQSLTLQTGDQTVKIAIGKSTTEAAVSIELKVGASSLKLEPAKITLKSPQIAIQGDAMVEVTAPMTKITGSAVLALQGGIIKIN